VIAEMEYKPEEKQQPRITVTVDMISTIRNEMFNFLENVHQRCPNHDGFIIASSLPQPLNFILGTLLKTQVYKNFTLIEKVGGNYVVARIIN